MTFKIHLAEQFDGYRTVSRGAPADYDMTDTQRVLGLKRVSVAIVEPLAKRRGEMRDALRGHGFEVLADADGLHSVLPTISASGRSPTALLLSSRVLVGDLFGHLRDLRATMPYTRVVVCLSRVDGHRALECFEAGIAGCVAEGLSIEALASMLPLVIEDHKVFPSFVLETQAAVSAGAEEAVTAHGPVAEPGTRHAEATAIGVMTRAERLVLEELARGATNKEIADTLGLTDATVKVHVRNIMKKLELNSRTKIALWAVRQGLG